jgi:hypothetical protein
MDERINGGSLVAAFGGVLLVISVFLDWYEPDLSAWDVFELADLVLVCAGVAAIAGLFKPLVEHRIAPDPARSRGLFFLGLAALIVIVAGLIQAPPSAAERSPELGAWLGLAGALIVTVGGLLASSHISVVVNIRTREGEADTPAEGIEPVPPPPPSEAPVPPPPGTEPAEPDSETSSIPEQR